MSRIENKIENRAIRKTLNIEEEEEVVQQLFLLFLAPKCSKECFKGGCTATRGLGMMMDGFCDDRVLK